MTPRRVPVFFYGLFMDVDLLRSKGTSPIVLGLARVDGFKLRVGRRAAVMQEPGSVVHGILMALAREELDRLYAEPSLQAYKAEPVLARTAAGEGVAALCYNLPEPPSEADFNAEYARNLRELAERLGLPQEYVDAIGAFGNDAAH